MPCSRMGYMDLLGGLLTHSLPGDTLLGFPQHVHSVLEGLSQLDKAPNDQKQDNLSFNRAILKMD